MIIKIKNNNMGYNGCCRNCKKLQNNGDNPQPLLVYYKDDNEKRGHNMPVCSLECAKAYIEKINK